MALYLIHSKSIIHRDIKPHNLFLNAEQTVVKLGDFGVSKKKVNEEDNAKTFVGTPYYLAPEILQ